MVQGAKRYPTLADRLKKRADENTDIYNLMRNRHLSSQVISIPTFTGGASATQNTTGFLRTSGDTMLGPIAFFPALITIANGEIDIGKDSGNFTSRVIVAPASGSADNLLTITGAAHNGQLLFLQGIATNTITLKDSLSSGTAWAVTTAYALDDIVSNGGNLYVCKSAHTSSATDEPGVGANWTDFWFKANIETIDGMDFSLTDDDIIIFQFDSTDNNWQQVTTGKQNLSSTGDHVIRDFGTTSGTLNCKLDGSDAGDGFSFKVTANGDVTLTFDNPPASGTQHEFEVEFIQDATGNHSLTLPGTVTETVIVAPGAGRKTILSFRTNDGGATYNAVPVLRGSINVGSASFALVTLDNLGTTAINADLIQAGTPASAGFLRIQNAKEIAWRNAGNTGDIGISVNALDQIALSGTPRIVGANGLSMSGTIADSGTIRMANNTSIRFRNAANSANKLFRFNASDEFEVDANLDMNSNLIKAMILESGTANPAAAGVLRLAVSNTIRWRNNANSADLALSIDGSDNLLFDGAVIGGGASTALDNLASVAINTSLISDTNLTDNLGSSGIRWNILYTGGINASGTQTWGGAIDASGSAITNTGKVAPQTTGVPDLGDSTHYWDNCFTESLTLRGSGGDTTASLNIIYADSSQMIFNTPINDGFLWKSNNASLMQWTNDGTNLYMRAAATKVVGYIPDSSSITLGTSGSLQLPVDTGSVGNAAAADTDFGDNVGCIGLYLNTIGSGNPTLCIKIDDGTGIDNRWLALTYSRTTGAFSGGILT